MGLTWLLLQVIRAHDLSVTAMHATHVGLATGGKDGYVKLWGPGFEHLRTYDLSVGRWVGRGGGRDIHHIHRNLYQQQPW